MPNAKSRIAGHYMLEAKPNTYCELKPPMKAPILFECNVLKHVVCLVPEAKIGGIFHNG